MNTPNDLIGLKEAAKLVPSPRGGKGVHINSLRRWCLTGRLRYWRQGPWLFVSKADLATLFTAQEKPQAAVDASLEKVEAFLRARGL